VTGVLRTERLSVCYGGVHALEDVDLVVGEGELVGLIGPNGAGKTTLIDAVGGFASSGGRVTLLGEDVSGSRPTGGRAAVSRGRGSPASCSTICRCARTCSSRPEAPASA